MTWLIGVPFSMILGIVALYATLRQAPVPRTAGDSTLAYDALRTIMPIAGWPEERAREVEISVGADQVRRAGTRCFAFIKAQL